MNLKPDNFEQMIQERELLAREQEVKTAEDSVRRDAQHKRVDTAMEILRMNSANPFSDNEEWKQEKLDADLKKAAHDILLKFLNGEL